MAFSVFSSATSRLACGHGGRGRWVGAGRSAGRGPGADADRAVGGGKGGSRLDVHQVLLLRAQVGRHQEEAVPVALVAVVQKLLGRLLREQRARVVGLDVVVLVELLHLSLRHLPVDAAVGGLEAVGAAAGLLNPVLHNDGVSKLLVLVGVCGPANGARIERLPAEGTVGAAVAAFAPCPPLARWIWMSA